ncbi:MAG: hypothetical protein ACE5EA_08825 [Nitrospirota bacterium]
MSLTDLILLLLFCIVGSLFYRKNISIWIGSYIRQRLKGRPELKDGEPLHIIFCMVDHFEPIYKELTREEVREQMKTWTAGYPEMADKHSDSNGRPPQHTWFYPGEAYDPERLDELADLCRKGYGEIEFHHHHHYETSEGLRESIKDAIAKFTRHGALITDTNPLQHAYAFIHGNMALDNSRLDDRWCGVNDELIILKETGCYADFSAPTAPCSSQTRKINSIYYARDDPERPKSHNIGIDVEVSKEPSGDLMIIQGPLAPNWKRRKFGIIPTIDNGEIHKDYPGTPDRVNRWIRQHIHVKGRPDWIFVKVSCHGAQNQNFDALLGEPADEMYSYLEERYCNKDNYRLHYVTARELYNIIKAAEAGKQGNPYDYKDYIIPQYLLKYS